MLQSSVSSRHQSAPSQPATRPSYQVRNGRNAYHLIPYIGNKSGFAHIFDKLVPDSAETKQIIDVFGGSGSFAIYCCFKFGSDHVIYNDNNPILTNFMRYVRDDPGGLIRKYNEHRRRSSPEYFMETRAKPLDRSLAGAGRFLYLSKNAFSGKIRFNHSNKFNVPMRKSDRCPAIATDRIYKISDTIQQMKITNHTFEYFESTKDAFLYLDPPYMNNTNGHYNGVPATEDFARFVNKTSKHNLIMISEQNEPSTIGILGQYFICDIWLRRSLQYFTKRYSKEIIATNYTPERAVHDVE